MSELKPTFCRRSLKLLSGVVMFALAANISTAQTLARPGWAGSGLEAEAWWRSALFYRIEPNGFQDSDGGSIGDLSGIAQRMDYLQSLGVDAIVLEPPFKDDGFDDLLTEASHHHIRIVVALDRRFLMSGTALTDARAWLTRGAAGIFLHDQATEPMLHDLRALAASFPGQRVLLAAHAPVDTAAHRRQRSEGADLVEFQIAEANDNVATLRSRLESALTTTPLLLTEGEYRAGGMFRIFGEPKTTGIDKIVATILLTSRGAVSLLYGQEIGTSEGTHIGPQTMQWTPSNITPPAKPEEPVEAPKPMPNPDVYGAFVPYVTPLKKPEKPAAEVRVDPNSLRGFTSGKLPESSEVTNNETANVAVEDSDPNSLLNFYRHLVQLHHGNSSLRSGTPIIFDRDAEKALVWIRRAPARARTAATVVMACNVSAKPLTLSLDRDLARLHIRPGTLRPLLSSWTTTPQAQSTSQIVLPPYSSFVGELYHH